MRGDDDLQEGIFSYISPEKRVPADHPLRPIRQMVDGTLKEMSPKFANVLEKGASIDRAGAAIARTAVASFLTVRSERIDRAIEYNMLFAGSWGWRWTRRYGISGI